MLYKFALCYTKFRHYALQGCIMLPKVILTGPWGGMLRRVRKTWTTLFFFFFFKIWPKTPLRTRASGDQAVRRWRSNALPIQNPGYGYLSLNFESVIHYETQGVAIRIKGILSNTSLLFSTVKYESCQSVPLFILLQKTILTIRLRMHF